VISVAMLTEGWDANTVTHILGIRAFSSQLLCEQVVGRALRRRSYALNDDGLFEPEYANVYGIPFAFIPSDRPTVEALARPAAVMVESMPGREHLRIVFPKLDGYRVEVPDEELIFAPDTSAKFLIGPSTVPTRTDVEGIVGAGEHIDEQDLHLYRPQQVAYALARRLLYTYLTVLGDDPRPRLVTIGSEFRPAYSEKTVGGAGASKYDLADDASRPYRLDNITSQSQGRAKGEGAASWFPVRLDGQVFRPTMQSRWKTHERGMDRLLLAGRVTRTRNTLAYVRYLVVCLPNRIALLG
jgi:hypothetical protein